MYEQNPESSMMNLPDVEAYFMVEIFMSMGLATAMPMGGLGPLSYTDVDAWNRVYDIDLALWEVDTVLNMSREYVKSFNEFHEKDVGPPVALPGYVPTEEQRADVAARLKSVLGRRRRK